MRIENDATPVPRTKRLILTISDNSEFFSETADYALIELGAREIGRIRQLAAAVRELEVYRISEFNYACDFKVADYEADPEDGKVALGEFTGRMECNTLNVTDCSFFWSGLYRNTSVRWETDSFPLMALDDASDYDQREVYPGTAEGLEVCT